MYQRNSQGKIQLMQALIKELTSLKAQVEQAKAKLKIAEQSAEVNRLEAETKQADFWRDSAAATATSKRLADLKKHVEVWDGLSHRVNEALEMASLNDQSLKTELEHSALELGQTYAKLEFELKLAGPYDAGSAILSIYAGTGGTDAQDWAEMLERMYLRYSEQAGFKAEVLDLSPGEEAGLKSVTFEVNGPYAYGKLKGEKGVHRLVRLSPFNSDHLRQTSFALVEVMPRIDQPEQLEIDPKDLRIDVFRAGGHGGQSVNTTDSAVRITHLPTGLVVSIQNERSQLANREKAMAVLRSRLAALMLDQHKEKLSEIRGQNQSAEWGSQIRSYVLHPYTKVKDHRTGHETSAAEAVLNGDLDGFIEAYLASRIGQAEPKS